MCSGGGSIHRANKEFICSSEHFAMRNESSFSRENESSFSRNRDFLYLENKKKENIQFFFS